MNRLALSALVSIGIFAAVSPLNNYGQAENKEGNNVYTETYQSIIITGSPEFISKTKAALKILEQTPEFYIVQSSLGAIKSTKHSGVNVCPDIPVYMVGEATSQSPLLWYASTIAHDAYHSFLYHHEKERLGGKEPAFESWMGKEAEKSCLVFQLGVLQKFTHEECMIGYLQELIRNPTYQNYEYKDRSW